MNSFSRRAFAPERYENGRMVSSEWRMDSIRYSQFAIRKGTKRVAKTKRRWWCLAFRLRKLRKNIGSETPTDAILVFCRALRARPRLQRRSSTLR